MLTLKRTSLPEPPRTPRHLEIGNGSCFQCVLIRRQFRAWRVRARTRGPSAECRSRRRVPGSCSWIPERSLDLGIAACKGRPAGGDMMPTWTPAEQAAPVRSAHERTLAPKGVAGRSDVGVGVSRRPSFPSTGCAASSQNGCESPRRDRWRSLRRLEPAARTCRSTHGLLS